MFTRYPRIPNVKFTDFFHRSYPLRSLVHVAASESQQSATGLIRLPAFFTPKTWDLQDLYLGIYTSKFEHNSAKMDTDVLPVDPERSGNITVRESKRDLIDEWDIQFSSGRDFEHLKRAAEGLLHTDVPVAFPTETVYGLGADATRSSAVKAIFAAKGRPADNPLIVHVHSLQQLRGLLCNKHDAIRNTDEAGYDPIPEIYRPLIERFWPGPLTIILPLPKDSLLAPEVTAGLSTFGARMPRSILALSLLRLCDRPLAAPSANASTRPSPTAAEHVFDDLQGKIHTIIDGGPCEVGVESTVVDGVSGVPTILRPGGVTVEQLRQCPGWGNVVSGYKDKQEASSSRPRAPGMKYRHYSPKAEVILYEAGAGRPSFEEGRAKNRVGVVRTKSWGPAIGLDVENSHTQKMNGHTNGISQVDTSTSGADLSSSRLSNLLRSMKQHRIPHAHHYTLQDSKIDVWDVDLGAQIEDVARGLFSALRELDKKGVEVIYVEGIDDSTGNDIAAAVMNRLRKAAEIRV